MRFMLLPLAISLLGTGCPKTTGSGTAASTQEAGTLGERTTDDGLVEQQIDINGDGKADIYNNFQPRTEGVRHLVRKEVDLNWDGQVDVRTWFDPSGKIEKEEMDGDFDGHVDWLDHYQGGMRVLSEVYTENDGHFDLFRIYEGGKVRRKERDTNGDQQVDFWEYLDENGNVVKVGQDVDGDGVMDVRED